jgi:hypothetical protein
MTIPTRFKLPKNYPSNYARFVYCLAYGEQQLTKNNGLHPQGDGTPEYWKILYACNNHPIDGGSDFHPILHGGTPNFEQRLINKIGLLYSLQQKGIWLVDSSIAALIRKNPDRPEHEHHKDEDISNAIRTSWQYYTREVAKTENPKHIVCIGKEVCRVLGGDLRKIVGNHYTVIDQPNSYLSAEQRVENLKLCSNTCHGTKPSASLPSVERSIHFKGSDTMDACRIKELFSRAIKLDSVQIVGRYTEPYTYGVYDVKGSGVRYRYGNHPIRMEELTRECGNVSLVALFIERGDAHELTLLLNRGVRGNSSCS